MDTEFKVDKRSKEYRDTVKSKDGQVNELATTVEMKIDRVISLLERVVDKLDRQFEGRISSQPVPEPPLAQDILPVMPVHIPFDYRMIVDDMLNKNFEIEIMPHRDSPQFDFTIVVPDKYSSMSEEMRKMYGKDRRLKVLSYSDGISGVRAYVEKVWSNFNPTIQALIVSDRM